MRLTSLLLVGVVSAVGCGDTVLVIPDGAVDFAVMDVW